MGFEAPLFLLGLVLAGAPIVAHLRRRRDVHEAPLPTLRFVEAAIAESRRRHRLTDLLLLLMRALMIACWALALAQPHCAADATRADAGPIALAIVIDDSASMGASAGDETALASALDAARGRIERLATGSTVSIFAAGAPARTLARGQSPEVARAALGSLHPTARGGDLAGAVALASRWLSTEPAGARALFVASDFADAETAGIDGWPEGVRVTLHDRGRAPVENASVHLLDVGTSVRDPSAQEVRALVTGARGAEVTVTLRAANGARSEGTWPTSEGRAEGVLVAPGPAPLTLSIEAHDALPLDDTAYVPGPQPVPDILLVNGDAHSSPFDDAVALPARALRATEAFDVSVVDPDALTRLARLDADLLMLLDVDTLEPAAARAILGALERGAGLIVAGSERARDAYAGSALDPVLPARIGPAGGQSDALGIHTEGALASPGLERVAIRRRLELDARDGAEIVATAASGAPLVVWSRREGRRVAVTALPLDTAWSDLPFRPGYVPFISALAAAIARPSLGAIRSPAPGTPLDLGRLGLPVGAEIVAPDGRVTPLEGLSQFEETDLAGLYEIQRADGDPLARFAVHAPRVESTLVPSPPEAPTYDAGGAAPGRERQPAGPFFFLLGALFAIAEGVLRWPVQLLVRRVAGSA